MTIEEAEKPKRKKPFSAVQYSLKKLRSLGYTCGITEKWNAHVHIKQDLFGFIDIVAMLPGMPLLAIQATGNMNGAAHMKKILGEPRALVWLQAGGRIFLHSWEKHKVKRGGVAIRWDLNETEIVASDFPSNP